MISLLAICQQLGPLTAAAADELEKAWTTKTFAKDKVILDSENICRNIFFIESGLVKLFSNRSGKQFIMRFSADNSFITVIDSFLLQKPSKYQLVALEDTRLRTISKNAVECLCSSHHCVERLFRSLIAMAAINMMERINEMLEDNATVRYHNFVSRQPDLLQRIKLGDLAAYLGVTQTTLSRIRAKK